MYITKIPSHLPGKNPSSRFGLCCWVRWRTFLSEESAQTKSKGHIVSRDKSNYSRHFGKNPSSRFGLCCWRLWLRWPAAISAPIWHIRRVQSSSLRIVLGSFLLSFWRRAGVIRRGFERKNWEPVPDHSLDKPCWEGVGSEFGTLKGTKLGAELGWFWVGQAQKVLASFLKWAYCLRFLSICLLKDDTFPHHFKSQKTQFLQQIIT